MRMAWAAIGCVLAACGAGGGPDASSDAGPCLVTHPPDGGFTPYGGPCLVSSDCGSLATCIEGICSIVCDAANRGDAQCFDTLALERCVGGKCVRACINGRDSECVAGSVCNDYDPHQTPVCIASRACR